MIEQAIDIIKVENLEKLATKWHKPIKGNYVIVSEDRKYKVLTEKEAEEDINCNYMDYYSELVSMNKPVTSKLISSNNIYTFFCRNVAKLQKTDIYDYFTALNLPSEKEWHINFIVDNIKSLADQHTGIIKIFFPGTLEEYRKAGIANWYDKSITRTKYCKDPNYGTPVGFTVNPKKPYTISTRQLYLVNRDKGLQFKIFYDILKGMARHNYNILYMWDDNILPCKFNDLPDCTIIGGIMLVFKLDDRGQVQIVDMDTIPRYDPHI